MMRFFSSLFAGAKNATFEPFIYRNDHFTKTGSGKNIGKTPKKGAVFLLPQTSTARTAPPQLQRDSSSPPAAGSRALSAPSLTSPGRHSETSSRYVHETSIRYDTIRYDMRVSFLCLNGSPLLHLNSSITVYIYIYVHISSSARTDQR